MLIWSSVFIFSSFKKSDQSERAHFATFATVNKDKLTPRESQVLERIIAGRLNKQIADDLKIPVKKVDTVRTAFTMSFNPVTEQNCVIESTENTETNFGDLLTSHNELLFRITDLESQDETFLIDYLVKKRSVSTLLRKNPHLKKLLKKSSKFPQKLLCHQLARAW